MIFIAFKGHFWSKSMFHENKLRHNIDQRFDKIIQWSRLS